MQELLALVPKPVAAVLLLFPVTDATEAARKAEQGAHSHAHWCHHWWHSLHLPLPARVAVLSHRLRYCWSMPLHAQLLQCGRLYAF